MSNKIITSSTLIDCLYLNVQKRARLQSELDTTEATILKQEP